MVQRCTAQKVLEKSGRWGGGREGESEQSGGVHVTMGMAVQPIDPDHRGHQSSPLGSSVTLMGQWKPLTHVTYSLTSWDALLAPRGGA